MPYDFMHGISGRKFIHIKKYWSKSSHDIKVATTNRHHTFIRINCHRLLHF